LLLLTTAIAALLALGSLYYQRSRPFGQTTVPKWVNDGSWIRACCKTLGHPLPSCTNGSGPLRDWDGCQWHTEYQTTIPTSKRGALMDAILLEFLAIRRDCAIEKYMARGKNDARGLAEFHYSYCKGQNAGAVFVSCADGPDGVRLSVYVHEHNAVR
jgi:hypothetical protein